MSVVRCAALAAICLLLQVKVSAGQCPPDFTFNNYKCYKLSTTNAPRDQAAAICSAIGAELVSPQDSDQQRFIQSLLSSQRPSWKYIWTSLIQSRSDWHWSFDNRPLYPSPCFTKASATSLIEYTFHTAESFTPPLCKARCQSQLGNNLKSWAVTMKNCTNQGATCLNGKQAACYCGSSHLTNTQPAADCNTSCPGNTTYNCGSEQAFYNPTPAITEWVAGEENTKGSNDLCMALGFQESFKWISQPCSALMRYICKFYFNTSTHCVNVSSQHTIQWYQATNQCYGISTEAFNWFEAQQQCEMNGGILLKPPTGLDFRIYILSAVNQYTGNKTNVLWDFWTAGVATRLKWANGNTSLYTNFADTNPDITRGGCIALRRTSSPPYQWESRPCEESRPFVCVKDGAPQPA